MQGRTRTADNWHGNDLLLLKIGRNWLQGHGYINTSDAKVEPGSAINLHPAVIRKCWDDSLTDAQWDAIQDVLILVSRILDDPVILEFYNGILRVDKHVRIDNQTANHLMTQYTDRLPVSFRTQGFNDDDRTRRKLWRTIRDMADSVQWQFGGNTTGTWGHSLRHTGIEGLPRDNMASETRLAFEANAWWGRLPRQSTDEYCFRATRCDFAYTEFRSIGAAIRLDKSFIDVLTHKVKANDAEASYKGHDAERGIDNDSALLRTKFFLALTMLHEFCHALWIAHDVIVATSDNNLIIHHDEEPYYRNHRSNELGFAFEQKVFSGVSNPTGLPHAAMPYGIRIASWPGLSSPSKSEAHLASAAKWGTDWNTIYVVHMDWVKSLFTKEFWEHPTNMYGIVKALKPPREVGVRRLRTEGLWPDESPSTPTKQPSSPNSNPSVESDADENLVVRRGAGLEVDAQEFGGVRGW